MFSKYNSVKDGAKSVASKLKANWRQQLAKIDTNFFTALFDKFVYELSLIIYPLLSAVTHVDEDEDDLGL